MRKNYVVITKPIEKIFFNDIFNDCKIGGKYSKTITDAFYNFQKTGKMQFWNGAGNQFLYMALGYLGVNIVCDNKCYHYNKYEKSWSVEDHTKLVKSISIQDLKSLNINNRTYNFNVISNALWDDKRFEVTSQNKEKCPLITYQNNRQRRNKEKNNVNSIIKYINKQTKSNTKNDAVK